MGVIRALLLVGLAAAAARGPAIRDLAIARSGVQILVSFELVGGFDRELSARLDSGLPTGFVYDLELLRDRKRWSDALLERSRIEVVAMYNAVTGEYLVNTKQDGRLLSSRTVRERRELEAAMTRLQAQPVFTVDRPSPEERYLVRARVELAPGEVLGFIPVRRTSSWVESNKVRIRG